MVTMAIDNRGGTRQNAGRTPGPRSLATGGYASPDTLKTPERLTTVALLKARGLSNPRIAEIMQVSDTTVANYTRKRAYPAAYEAALDRLVGNKASTYAPLVPKALGNLENALDDTRPDYDAYKAIPASTHVLEQVHGKAVVATQSDNRHTIRIVIATASPAPAFVQTFVPNGDYIDGQLVEANPMAAYDALVASPDGGAGSETPLGGGSPRLGRGVGGGGVPPAGQNKNTLSSSSDGGNRVATGGMGEASPPSASHPLPALPSPSASIVFDQDDEESPYVVRDEPL
jgi:hypothetical protein